MKKFSKLLAVLVALAVIICPMTSAIVANATSTGSYSIVAEDANNVVLTISSTDGFLVYLADVTFNNSSAFQSSYGSDGYTNGLKVIDYTLKSGSKDAYNLPAVSANYSGSTLSLLVSATDSANLELYTEVQVGIRVASGSTATLAKIQAADEGDVTTDPSLLGFGSKVNATTGAVDSTNNTNATTGESHTHTYAIPASDPYVVSAPTCTAVGQYRKKCSICGAVDNSAQGLYYGETYADHDPSVIDNDIAFRKSAATCTEPAVYYYKCSVCGQAVTEIKQGFVSTRTVGNALGHDLTNHPAVTPTCTTGGNTQYYSCSRCGKYFSNSSGTIEIGAGSWVIAATGHNMTPHAANAATCTAAGNSAYWSCDRCNKFFSDAEGETEIAENSWVIAATGHTEETIPAVAATCTTAGATAGVKCSVCDAVLTAPTPIAALGHNMTPHAANAATCTAAGNSAYYSCDRCNKYFSDAEGNTEIAENSWVIAATGHTEETIPAVAATCTTAGATAGVKCSVCDAILTAPTPIAALGHNMTPHAANAATCTAAGNSAYWSCDRCNKFFSDAEGETEIAENSWVIAATGVHTWGEYVSNNDATCTVDGTKTATCTVCHVATDTVTDTGSALGHDYTYTENGDGTHDIGCTRCDYALENQACVDENEDNTCDLCGADLTPAGSVLDASINILTPQIQIQTSMDIIIRASKATTSGTAGSPYASSAVVFTAQRFNNNLMKYYADPITVPLEDYTTKNNAAIYYNIASYEIDLPISYYVACYDALGNEVAHSETRSVTPSELLKSKYKATPSNEVDIAMNRLVTDTLNLGYAAQAYFAPQVNGGVNDLGQSAPINDEWPQTYASESVGTLTDVTNFAWNTDSSITDSTNPLRLTADISGAPVIKFSILRATATGSHPLDYSKLTLQVSYTTLFTQSGSPEIRSDVVTGSAWNQYVDGKNLRYNFTKAAMYDANKTVTFVLTYDSVEVCTCTYSMDSYIYSSDTSIATALGKFNASARAYFIAQGNTV